MSRQILASITFLGSIVLIVFADIKLSIGIEDRFPIFLRFSARGTFLAEHARHEIVGLIGPGVFLHNSLHAWLDSRRNRNGRLRAPIDNALRAISDKHVVRNNEAGVDLVVLAFQCLAKGLGVTLGETGPRFSESLWLEADVDFPFIDVLAVGVAVDCVTAHSDDKERMRLLGSIKESLFLGFISTWKEKILKE